MESLVSITDLSKKFGSFSAVSGLSFSVNKGEVLGFLGPNGAGKTTTMRMITGYFPPTSGEIEVCGFNVLKNRVESSKRIGYLPEGGPLYNDMTPETFLGFMGEIRGLKGDKLKERMDFVIQKLHLSKVLKQNIDTLSKGFKRRVALAQAIIHDPEVLILDEPTDGLDPNQKHEVRELIKSMAKDKAIIISTHILEEVEAICSRAIVIAGGKIVASGTTDEITRKASSHNSVVIKLKNESADKILHDIRALQDIAEVKMEGQNSVIAFPKNGKYILPDISDMLYRQKYQIEELYSRKGALDEAFRELTN